MKVYEFDATDYQYEGGLIPVATLMRTLIVHRDLRLNGGALLERLAVVTKFSEAEAANAKLKEGERAKVILTEQEWGYVQQMFALPFGWDGALMELAYRIKNTGPTEAEIRLMREDPDAYKA